MRRGMNDDMMEGWRASDGVSKMSDRAGDGLSSGMDNGINDGMTSDGLTDKKKG